MNAQTQNRAAFIAALPDEALLAMLANAPDAVCDRILEDIERGEDQNEPGDRWDGLS